MIQDTIFIGSHLINNRIVLQPMEGYDCELDGTPSDLTAQKYIRAAQSGAGTIWFEATAVCPEGRTNDHQMMLTEHNLNSIKELLCEIRRIAKQTCGTSPLIIVQLTHSGRHSISPMIAYHNPLYEATHPVSDENIVSDEYLDTLKDKYVATAKLAIEAGFDGVDVKCCHGYLFQELLSAFDRKGKYGGSFENRSRLYLDCVSEIKRISPPDFLITTRLSVSDMIPKPYGFGTNESNELCFKEPDMLIQRLIDAGVELLNVTVGNPYYNPHVNRPYRIGAYTPPEAQSVGLARFEAIEKHIKEAFPSLPVLASGMSYYRDDLMDQAQRLLEENVCDLVGFGRMWLAYPTFYRDFLDGKFEVKKCCLACSKCTELMRGKRASGCAVFNEYYRNLYKEMKK